jgi:hypothetical protein
MKEHHLDKRQIFTNNNNKWPSSYIAQYPTLRTEGILRKLQKVMQLTQKWKDFENNGTT